MRIVIAPDSFKGSLSAAEVAESLAQGISSVLTDADIVCKPVADGGEGIVEALVAATSGRFVETDVTGPLGIAENVGTGDSRRSVPAQDTPAHDSPARNTPARKVRARWGILGDGTTAVIEVAAASGLVLVPPEARNPLITTSYGTGELMRAALDAGCRRIIVGLGGSATNDGGAGMAQALGVQLLDETGQPLSPGGAALARLRRVDVSGVDPRLAGVEVIGAADVNNPLLGPTGATAVFGPQKGASPDDVLRLEAALAHYADVLSHQLGVDVRAVPGGGAAGGLGAALHAFCRAPLQPGADVVMEAIRLEELIRDATLVITGEGKLDGQTAFGKAPLAVARLAARCNKPVIAVAGMLGDGVDELFDMGIDAAITIAPGPIDLHTSMEQAPKLLVDGGRRLARLLQVGMRLRDQEG